MHLIKSALPAKDKIRALQFSTLTRNAVRTRIAGSKSIMFIVTFEPLFNTMANCDTYPRYHVWYAKAKENHNDNSPLQKQHII